jgi:GxxExxY protein
MNLPAIPARHQAGGNEILNKDLSYKIAQTLNYLKATGLRLAIILNFSKEKLEYKRIVK